MRNTVSAIGQVFGIVVVLALCTSGVLAQLPHQSTGHLVTAAEYNAIIDAVNAATVPSGAVEYFNLNSCPAGWTELTSARGMYLVGLPAGGTLNSAVGSALTNLEARAHTHSVPGLSVPGLTVPGLNFDIFTASLAVSGTTDATGVSGTTNGDGGGRTSNENFGGFSGYSDVSHTHTFNAGTHTHTFSGTGPAVRAAGTTSGSTSGTGTTGTGTSGTQSATIAPYIQLLVCQKT